MPHKEEYAGSFATAEELIEEARNGRMFILVDDPDRENEGDLVIPAQFCTPDAVTFMARFGRGLICLALTAERCEALGLPLMMQGNAGRLETAFTYSIEAREGVTTGISSADRARTVAVATGEQYGRQDIVTPGHVFPLKARDGGVLVRAGHTEAAVDIPRLAGLNPSGVICEIINDDGTMARVPDLIPFAQRHGLKIGSISDLIRYRIANEKQVRRLADRDIDSAFGGRFHLYVYESVVGGVEHLVLVKGDISGPEPVLTRVHGLDLMRDMLGTDGPGASVQVAMETISAEGRGVLVLLRKPHATSITRALSDAEMLAGRTPPDLRVYGIGAQILHDLGVRDMTLLTDTPVALVGLSGFGLNIVGTRRLTAEAKAS